MIGQRVGCRRQAPAKGNWRRWEGRQGTIVSIVVSRSVSPEWPDVTEIGVSFDGSKNRLVWFLPSELVIQTPQGSVSVAELLDEQMPQAA